MIKENGSLKRPPLRGLGKRLGTTLFENGYLKTTLGALPTEPLRSGG
jgi:hypothetical protein